MERQQIFIVADDHPLFRAALKETLNNRFNHPLVVEAHDIVTLQSCAASYPHANLVLLDLLMPGAHGFSGLIYLAAHHPEIPVIVISANESPEIVRRALNHGAAGFLPKSSPVQDIVAAVQGVLQGELWIPASFDPDVCVNSSEEIGIASIMATFTPQQFRVATMLAQGLLNKQIAYELNVKEATVKAHVTEIFRKLGVQSRTQAVLAISQLDVQMQQNIGCI